jgi:hypothetical protein
MGGERNTWIFVGRKLSSYVIPVAPANLCEMSRSRYHLWFTHELHIAWPSGTLPYTTSPYLQYLLPRRGWLLESYICRNWLPGEVRTVTLHNVKRFKPSNEEKLGEIDFLADRKHVLSPCYAHFEWIDCRPMVQSSIFSQRRGRKCVLWSYVETLKLGSIMPTEKSCCSFHYFLLCHMPIWPTSWESNRHTITRRNGCFRPSYLQVID